MRLARGLAHLSLSDSGCVATIGNFDGVHLGHRAVIENLAVQGKRLGLPVVVILFEPQPLEFFNPEQAPPRLTRLREKLARLAELPVDVALLLRFDRKLAESPAEEFIEKVLIGGLRIKHLVIGDDFRFGKGRRGDFSMLREAGARFGFGVADTVSVQIDRDRVSSTLIREALAAGNMDFADRLLGRPYSVCGRIVPGASLGRRFGFPTANIVLKHKKPPLQGVFAVTMTGIADRPLPGVANIGTRPTVAASPTVHMETHLFDFTGDIYGRRVEIHFHHKLREERRFDNVQALSRQIGEDAAAARAFLATVDKKN
ncbi:MAG TPA: bifunctional riboflavin kinase/FAD synthetase [Methylococcaceae bacterium]|jgi:riboflavin kinase/FMN adenylyltransferase|nr:bifunctional riboflavin kinase/FAD synthetase [Methylococcaceae bacterium]